MSAIDHQRQPVVLPQLEQQLYRRAMAAHVEPRAVQLRRRRITVRGLLLTLLGLAALGGTAVAAYPLWAPWLGLKDGERPSTTTQPPSSSQLQLLEPLRRPQTADDRAPAITSALRVLGAQHRGLNLDAVRLLATTGTGAPVILFTTLQTYRPDGTGSARAAICVFVGFSPTAADGASDCVPTPRFAEHGVQVELGGVGTSGGRPAGARRRQDGLWSAPLPQSARRVRVVGLVPDGVTRVSFGARRSARVRGNVYEVLAGDAGALPRPELHREG